MKDKVENIGGSFHTHKKTSWIAPSPIKGQKSPKKVPLVSERSFGSNVISNCHRSDAEDRVRMNKSHLFEQKETTKNVQKRSIEPHTKIIGRITQNLKMLESKISQLFQEQIREERLVAESENLQPQVTELTFKKGKISSLFEPQNRLLVQLKESKLEK